MRTIVWVFLVINGLSALSGMFLLALNESWPRISKWAPWEVVMRTSVALGFSFWAAYVLFLQ